MGVTDGAGHLSDWYNRRIGDATNDQEIHGYWLFFIGVVAGIAGVAIFAITDGATTGRGVGYAVAGLAPLFISFGAVLRFPLRPKATYLGAIGLLIGIVGIGSFLVVFPGDWSTDTGHLGVIAVYALGILLIGVAGAFVPLVTDPVREEYERLQQQATETETQLADAQTAVETERDRGNTLEATLADIEASAARFEMYEDKGGKWRWRLRHQNSHIIADSAQGYSSKQKCQQGMQSVRRNTLGAGILLVEPTEPDEVPDAEDPADAIPATEESVDSQSTYELYEDNSGEWRWRLRHDNGNIIADSGEGYSSRSNLNRALKSVRSGIATGSYLEIDPVAYEIYRDRSNEWRWRLIHQNGNILADSGEGYSRRRDARRAVESVRSNLEGAEVTES